MPSLGPIYLMPHWKAVGERRVRLGIYSFFSWKVSWEWWSPSPESLCPLKTAPPTQSSSRFQALAQLTLRSTGAYNSTVSSPEASHHLVWLPKPASALVNALIKSKSPGSTLI